MLTAMKTQEAFAELVLVGCQRNSPKEIFIFSFYTPNLGFLVALVWTEKQSFLLSLLCCVFSDDYS